MLAERPAVLAGDPQVQAERPVDRSTRAQQDPWVVLQAPVDRPAVQAMSAEALAE